MNVFIYKQLFSLVNVWKVFVLYAMYENCLVIFAVLSYACVFLVWFLILILNLILRQINYSPYWSVIYRCFAIRQLNVKFLEISLELIIVSFSLTTFFLFFPSLNSKCKICLESLSFFIPKPCSVDRNWLYLILAWRSIWLVSLKDLFLSDCLSILCFGLTVVWILINGISQGFMLWQYWVIEQSAANYWSMSWLVFLWERKTLLACFPYAA